MFKKLHIQMTFYCTLVTTLVVLAMTCLSLAISENGMKEKAHSSFITNLTSMLSYLEAQDTLSHQWLRQTEHNYGFYLEIQDNGRALQFQHLNDIPNLYATAQRAREKAAEDYAFSLNLQTASPINSSHVTFKIKDGSGEESYASVALIPKKSGYLGVTVICSLESLRSQIWQQRILFLGIGAVAAVLLAVFSWLFTRKMIRPIEENRKKQVQFIASASHELRSPLAVILSGTSAMKRADVQELEKFRLMIQQEGERMSRLVEDMLSLANADNYSWSIRKEPAEPDTLLLQTYEKFQLLARKKQIQLSIDLPEEPVPACQWDSERIAQVLSLLTDNALSYTPAKGKVCLGLSLQAGKLCFTVRDTGPGIPDSQKTAVFERFYRMDTAHHDKSHFGLGLSIAREIVRLHNGKIYVEDAPGGGAVFSVILPCTVR